MDTFDWQQREADKVSRWEEREAFMRFTPAPMRDDTDYRSERDKLPNVGDEVHFTGQTDETHQRSRVIGYKVILEVPSMGRTLVDPEEIA